MSIFSTYLLNVALHAAILSILASVVLIFMRPASHRSMTAIAGLLAIGVLPWLTALRLASEQADSSSRFHTPAPALPVWTVVKMKAPASATQPVVDSVPLPVAAVSSKPAAKKFHWPQLPATLVFLWAAGTFACMLPMVAAWLKIRAWRRNLLPVDDETWRKISTHADGLVPRGTFLMDGDKSSPCVTGWWHPRIVLPRFLLEEKSHKELGWAVRHEVGHWQAGDSRWMILFCLIRNVNWWNPLVRRLLTQWEEAREQVCDLRAAGVAEQRAEYGEFLIAMSRGVTRRTPLTVTMARRGAGQLRKRIRLLLGALVGADRPMGKMPLGLVCGWLVVAAVLVSGVRIRAEENAVRKMVSKVATTASAADANNPSDPPVVVSIAPDSKSQLIKATTENSKWKITTQLVLSPLNAKSANVTPANLSGPLGDEQAATLLKNLIDHGGSTYITPPPVSALAGQETKVEFYWPVAGKMGPSKETDPFVGVKLRLTPQSIQGDAELRISTDYRYFPGIPEPLGMILDARGDLPAGLDPARVKIQNQEVTFRLRSGQTRCQEIGKDEQGRTLWLFTKIEATAPQDPESVQPAATSGPAKRQIKLSTRFIISKTLMGFTDGPASENNPTGPIFSENQINLIMKAVAQSDSFLATTPSFTALSGQQARLEIIRNVPGNSEQISKPASGTEIPFVGVRSTCTSTFSDDAPPRDPLAAGPYELAPEENTMELAYDVEYRFVPGVYQSLLNNHAVPPTNLDPEKIRSIKKSIKCRLHSGMSMAMNLGEIEPGKFLSVLVRAEAIDAAGRPLGISKTEETAESTDFSPSPQTKGKVRLRGTIVDIPRTGGPVAGSAPTYPTVAKAMLKIPGAKIRKLKTVEIPLFERQTPWPEIRELRVSAIASEDHTRVTFARWTFEGAGEFPETWLNLPAGSTMNLSIATDDPSIDRRLLIEIEPGK